MARTTGATLCPLILAYLDESQQQRQPSKLLSIDPNVLPKFAGFERLEELHLIHNRITTLDDLVGAVCLPRLRRLFLEGNFGSSWPEERTGQRDSGARVSARASAESL
ncbi:hypothetical protein HK105_202908 [Polyrhizophydium stewartii]|uniref:Uncharacterized protein n=1 Tax=Polyrhizophydium stewartii TaxID=2732419 RepID=A0ABR4NDR4_9FUNG